MEKKTKLSLELFVILKEEQERNVLRLLIIANLFLLASTLVLMFISEEIFKLGILSWPHYWIIFVADILFFSYFILSLIKDFKIWFLKYIAAIMPALIIGVWIYFTDPAYTRPLFFWLIIAANLLGLMFYDIKVLFLSYSVAAICVGLLLFHYSRIGVPFPLYEVYLMYVISLVMLVACFYFLKRTRLFLIELLEKRKEAEEAKTVLEVKVKARTQELEELTKDLDQRVKKRTAQLQTRVSQLERFSKLTVGRELKMAELKKEIEKRDKEIERLEKKVK